MNRCPHWRSPQPQRRPPPCCANGRGALGWGLWLIILAVWVCATPAAAQAEAVRVVLSGPAVPYESVTYAIERKRGALVVTVSKRFVKPFGGRDEVSLLTEEAWAELRTALEAGGVFTLPSVKGPKARSTTRVEADWGSRQHSWTVDDPGISFDGRHAHCIALVRALVSKRVGEIEFRDVMLLPGESGRLRVFADRPATVALDGVLLGSNTPLLSLRVSAGVHRVELRPLRSDAVYSYSVKVEAGKTTSLSVELK